MADLPPAYSYNSESKKSSTQYQSQSQSASENVNNNNPIRVGSSRNVFFNSTGITHAEITIPSVPKSFNVPNTPNVSSLTQSISNSINPIINQLRHNITSFSEALFSNNKSQAPIPILVKRVNKKEFKAKGSDKQLIYKVYFDSPYVSLHGKQGTLKATLELSCFNGGRPNFDSPELMIKAPNSGSFLTMAPVSRCCWNLRAFDSPNSAPSHLYLTKISEEEWHLMGPPTDSMPSKNTILYASIGEKEKSGYDALRLYQPINSQPNLHSLIYMALIFALYVEENSKKASRKDFKKFISAPNDCIPLEKRNEIIKKITKKGRITYLSFFRHGYFVKLF